MERSVLVVNGAIVNKGGEAKVYRFFVCRGSVCVGLQRALTSSTSRLPPNIQIRKSQLTFGHGVGFEAASLHVSCFFNPHPPILPFNLGISNPHSHLKDNNNHLSPFQKKRTPETTRWTGGTLSNSPPLSDLNSSHTRLSRSLRTKWDYTMGKEG